MRKRSPKRSPSFPASSTAGCSSAWRAPRSSPVQPASRRSARSTEFLSPEERDIVSFPMMKASLAACFVLALGAATAAAADRPRRAGRPPAPAASAARRPRRRRPLGRGARLLGDDPQRHRHEAVARPHRSGHAGRDAARDSRHPARAERPGRRSGADHHAGVPQVRTGVLDATAKSSPR